MKKLRWTQRLAIEEGIKAGKSNAQIARDTGVHRATIGREIARNTDCRENYSARTADDLSWKRQQEAASKRFLVSFNGVSYFQILQKHDRTYTYVSHTHPDALPHRYEFNWLLRWDGSYVRPGEHLRFAFAIAYTDVCLKPDTFSILRGLQFMAKSSRAFWKRDVEFIGKGDELLERILLDKNLLKPVPFLSLSRERVVVRKYGSQRLEKC